MKKEAKYSVVLKNGQPWLRWDQYETTYLKIWKSKSDKPYCKYSGMTVYLENEMIAELKKLI